MSKKSKRPGRAARDIHAAIKAQCEGLRQTGRCGLRPADALPDVEALMWATRRRVEASLPSTVVFEGRTYWLRIRLSAQYDIFDSPAAAEPMLRGAVVSSDDFGHSPGH